MPDSCICFTRSSDFNASFTVLESRSTISRGVPAGASSPIQMLEFDAGQSSFRHRRHIGDQRGALRLRDGERGELLVADQLQHVRRGGERDRDASRHQVGGGLRGRGIRRDHQVGARALVEELRGEMAGRAHLRAAEGETFRLRLGERDELLDGRHTKPGIRGEDERHVRDQRHRREVGGEIKVEVRRLRAADRARRRRHQQRVAVLQRAHHRLRGNVGAGAGPHLDDEGLAQRRAELSSDDPRGEIGHRAGREADHDLHRLVGIILRGGGRESERAEHDHRQE